jgi:putative CocE/NonD family hydrolase
MADGTRIALTVYMPDGGGPFPTVVESLPYRKDDDCTARDYSTFAYLASRGIAGVRIDVRGTGASTGIIENEYLPIEQQDNIEIFEWIAAQDWSNGNVGMWGISWGGFSSLQTAMLRPPQLKAIVAMHATHDRFTCDVHYVGGSLHAAEQVDWPPSMITTNALPPDPEIVGGEWLDEWLERLENTPQWPIEWLRHQHRDEFWRHGSPSVDYSSIECPTLLIGGWLDGYVDGMLALAQNLECPTRTVIGPWGHYRPATGKPGPTFDHLDLIARWFQHHLGGADNGVMDMPGLTAHIRTGTPVDPAEGSVTGYWRGERCWPPEDVSEIRLDLEKLQHDTTTWNRPHWVGSHAPAWDRSGISSGDGTNDDLHSMTFETEPLAENVEILGNPSLELGVTSNRPYGMVAARLLAVSPGGSSHLITRGNRNLAFPDSFDQPRLPVPGEPISLVFSLMATSAVIPAGSRIRLALSGADFPVIWPPPGEFELTIDPETSTLSLPTVTRDPLATRLNIGESPPPPHPPVEEVADSATWDVESTGNQTVFRRHLSSAEFQPTRNNLTYTTDQTWTVRVDDDDPGTTAVDATSRLSLSRPGWEVEVDGSISISGVESLRVEIVLNASHNGEKIWSKTEDESIPRVWV